MTTKRRKIYCLAGWGLLLVRSTKTAFKLKRLFISPNIAQSRKAFRWKGPRRLSFAWRHDWSVLLQLMDQSEWSRNHCDCLRLVIYFKVKTKLNWDFNMLFKVCYAYRWGKKQSTWKLKLKLKWKSSSVELISFPNWFCKKMRKLPLSYI